MNHAATHLSQYLDCDTQTIEAFDAELHISVAVGGRWRANTNEQIIAGLNCHSGVVGKTQGALRDTRLNEVAQARFVKGQVTTLNLFDSGGVDIHARDLVPNLGEHCRLH